MQAVGRIGSYISRSVYTVSGTFHPFGGAVDIIVVEQPDGGYKSSPWYVRFGKFQGVLKAKEKVVNISVNDVDADFHMYLDHKGEAFFMREVDCEEGESAFSPPSSYGEDMDGQSRNRFHLKSKSCNFDSNWSDTIVDERKAVTRANSSRPQFLGFVFGRRSASEEGIQMKEDASSDVKSESLELADLLDLKWSTTLASPKTKGKKENSSLPSFSDTPRERKFLVDDSSQDETGLVPQTSYQEMESTYEENGVEIKSLTLNVVETATSVERVREDITLSNPEPLMSGTGESDFQLSSVFMVSEVANSDSQSHDSVEKLNGLSDIQQSFGKDDEFSFLHEENVSGSGVMTEGYSQLVCIHQSNDSLKDIDSQGIARASCSSYSTCPPIDEQNISGQKDKHESSEGPLCDPQSCNLVPPCIPASSNAEDEQLLFGDLDGCGHMEINNQNHAGKETDSLFSLRVSDGTNESSDAKCHSSFSLDQSIIKDCLNDAGVQRTRLCSVASEACLNETGHDHPMELTRVARSLPSMAPPRDNLEASDCQAVTSDADKNHQSSDGSDTTAEDVEIPKESKGESANPSMGCPESTDSIEGSRSNWPFPFRRSTGRGVSLENVNGCENQNGVEPQNNSNNSERGTDVMNVKVNKKKVRTLTPTSEQLASLNLKEGKNIVIFTFSTSMLGKQQVDARIFLWRCDAKIVISDVDGTITRSDLLGQVMPLVGMDWSQTGVAHLFSAIKENGYQLLFLSARSISQSSITRQFLCNIKQDGKALPDGPVVISPDGLFPSLFREVVRRAPHEFKIACLEEIKALFTPGRNPFYAGFGNRDTDELSYLKVGIPRGKIFIINPKGEIAVNRRVDTKSYLALHALVHGMFPTMSTCEQEDFNSWNYWKILPPIMEL